MPSDCRAAPTRATHVKLGRGGLADVEWTVQLLQMRYAGKHPALRTTQTLAALDAAVAADLLDPRRPRRADGAPGGSASRIRNAMMLVRAAPRTRCRRKPATGSAWPSSAATDRDEASRFGDDYMRVARRASAAVDRVFWG